MSDLAQARNLASEFEYVILTWHVRQTHASLTETFGFKLVLALVEGIVVLSHP